MAFCEIIFVLLFGICLLCFHFIISFMYMYILNSLMFPVHLLHKKCWFIFLLGEAHDSVEKCSY